MTADDQKIGGKTMLKGWGWGGEGYSLRKIAIVSDDDDISHPK